MRRVAVIGAVCALLAVPAVAPAHAREAPTPTPAPAPAPDKSFAVYVGGDLTANGHPFLGGFGHEPSSHWVDIVARQQHPAGSTVQVGATAEADIPGELIRIPQASETARYITSNYSEFVGFPAPLTNGGLNEHGVAARDVWSDSRPELVARTPTPQRGPTYSDLSRIAMERAHSAREAVQIVGGLIDRYGYTTYGGNSHLFADANEGWVLVEMAGGQGLWAAERLGPDEVRVSYPGYIGEFPTTPDADHMASPDLVSYAAGRGWWRPGTPFDVQRVYGTPFPGAPVPVGGRADPADPSPYRHPPSLEAEVRRLAPATLQDVMRLVRDPRWSDDRSGYGQVAELADDLPDPGMGTLWLAVTAAVTAPYIPFHIDTAEVPVEYRQHRYLTHGAASEYLDPQYAEQEATESATQTFKRLMYATCARPERYLGEVTAAFEGFEAGELEQMPAVRARAADRYAAGDRPGAQRELTDASTRWAGDGLALGRHLLDDVLARSRADGGLREPRVPAPPGETASAQSRSMTLRSEETARDRLDCDLGGGWADGGTLARKGSYGDPADVPDHRSGADSGGASAWLVALTGVGGAVVGGAAVWAGLRSRRRGTPGA
ncbi:C69 family dipeptidase [Pseudonocardia sp. KRD291]|uniref:C69 family dipeptidase n=1 Tax=Pseudonocardia sp. KRD291 TaxID=2792007 RepID=UPI001C4A6C92|nr:C69 family dipeptidase [Pseudonocardia sp. KRD291]MBW0106891.1 C69 family dipeptidase [Pseudonocardia sp. KRD291]